MSTSRFSSKGVAGATAFGATATVLAILHPIAIDGRTEWPNDVPNRIAEMRRTLPSNLSNGSVLDEVQLDGTRLTLDLVVDDRLDLPRIRDDDRDEKCGVWRDALRSRNLTVIEYRYHQTGATSSLFLDRTVCG